MDTNETPSTHETPASDPSTHTRHAAWARSLSRCWRSSEMGSIPIRENNRAALPSCCVSSFAFLLPSVFLYHYESLQLIHTLPLLGSLVTLHLHTTTHVGLSLCLCISLRACASGHLCVLCMCVSCSCQRNQRRRWTWGFFLGMCTFAAQTAPWVNSNCAPGYAERRPRQPPRPSHKG